MNLVRFKIENHPQQVAKRGAKDSVDERITPQSLFDRFNRLYRFTLDAAASAGNAKCESFHTLETNGLEQSWAGESVWCNPPYSNIRPWVEKAWEESKHTKSIVMLLPANRTEQAWWQDLIEPRRHLLRLEFLRGRINFGVPGNEEGKWHSSAPFGCVALIWRQD